MGQRVQRAEDAVDRVRRAGGRRRWPRTGAARRSRRRTDAQLGEPVAAPRRARRSSPRRRSAAGGPGAGRPGPRRSPGRPRCQTVKSRCSVNAIAGSPSATARSQARRIVEESAVSHDQWVCTWLSGGGLVCRGAHRCGFSSVVPRSRAGGRSSVGAAAYCRRHEHRRAAVRARRPRRSPSCAS